MNRFYASVCCIVFSALVYAQDSRADLFGGYSYVNIDTNGLTSRQSANGWEASISGNFNKWFAVEGSVSGYYKNYSVSLSSTLPFCTFFACPATATIRVTDYSYAGGPRINFGPVFIHALFGGDHLTGTATATGVSGSLSESQDGAAGAAGGGVQWRVSGPWSVRASVDYAFSRHNIFGGPSYTQNNYRAGAGIVYSFGTRHPAEKPVKPTGSNPVPSSPRAPAAHATTGGTMIDALGVTVTLGRSSGAEIVTETPNGVAALAGLRPGDVINSVDGKPVRAPAEL